MTDFCFPFCGLEFGNFDELHLLFRFRPMDNLSGGEKTVAALALLFAIHRYLDGCLTQFVWFATCCNILLPVFLLRSIMTLYDLRNYIVITLQFKIECTASMTGLKSNEDLVTGAQIGISEGRGPIHEEQLIKRFKGKYCLRILLSRFISRGNTGDVY